LQFTPTDVDGCFVVDIEAHTDERGFFARAWCADEMEAAGAANHVAQINMSRSLEAGTIRGLHWQTEPHGESKFVRCLSGRIFDVCADVRPDSPTFMKWAAVELTPENHKAFSVPAGCAHGYQALADACEALYLVSSPYEPGVELGIRWDDPGFGIAWPIADASVSDKDQSWPDFSA
jgi:dTDP-4-dehydrorhamnose 3,5-epimerase